MDLHEKLRSRVAEVADFSIRVYEGRTRGFVHRPESDDDIKCAQETIAIGAIWLDIFSRDRSDRTDGAGLTRLTDDSFAYIAMEQMLQSVKPPSVATYLHDDPELLRNDRLANDKISFDS